MSARLDSCHGKAGAVLALVFVLGLTSGILSTYIFSRTVSAEEKIAIRVEATLNDLNGHLQLQPDQVEENQIEGRWRIMQFLQPDQQERFAGLIEGQSELGSE